MSNTYGNHLIVTSATPTRIDEFLEFIRDRDSEFSFNKVIPSPDPYPDGWVYKHWGCKWGADFLKMNRIVGGISMRFDTANGIPYPVIDVISKAFLDVEFTMTTIDWGSEDYLVVEWHNGERVEIMNPDSGDSE
jgi:hypothetical protein